VLLWAADHLAIAEVRSDLQGEAPSDLVELVAELLELVTQSAAFLPERSFVDPWALHSVHDHV